MMTSPKSGGPLGASVYPGGLRFAGPAIKAVKDADLTLEGRLEQIENMLHPTQEVNSTRVAAVRPRVLRAQVQQIEGQHRRAFAALPFGVPAGGLSASWRSAAAWRIA